MRPTITSVLSILCVLALLGLTWVFVVFGGPSIIEYWVANSRGDGFSFHFERCEGPTRTQANPIRPEWDASGTLLISTVAEANCGTSWMFGDYSIRSNTVILEYQAIVPLEQLCVCPHKVMYRIAGLPKKSYRVQLVARPEIYAMWVPVWFALGTALMVLAVIFAAACLSARRSARGIRSSEIEKAARRRKAIKVLGALLIISVGANIIFSYLAGSTYMSALTNEYVSDSIVGNLGERAGREQADRDFAAGMVRWYQFDDVEGVPHDKAARSVATLDVGGPALLHRYRKEFIDHYNWRMDELVSPGRHSKRRRR